MSDTVTTQSVGTPFGTFPTASSAIESLYSTLLGRPADEGGLSYWLDRSATGSWDDLLRDFGQGVRAETEQRRANIAETIASNAAGDPNPQPRFGVRETGVTETPFGIFPTASSAIQGLYSDVLGRTPDAGAEDYWLDRANKVGWEEAIQEFGQGALLEGGNVFARDTSNLPLFDLARLPPTQYDPLPPPPSSGGSAPPSSGGSAPPSSGGGGGGATFRTYTPPAPGSFDPFTAAMTGTIPSFFSYSRGQAPGTTTPATESNRAGYGGSEGVNYGGSEGASYGPGDFGSGVNMSGQMTGGLDLGPNPGNLDSLGNIDFSSLARGASLGNFALGPLGIIPGALAAAILNMSTSPTGNPDARAHAQVHQDLLDQYLSEWDALPSLPNFSAGLNVGYTQQDLDQAVAAAQAANIDADAQASWGGSDSGFGGGFGGGGDGQGGEGGDASGDGQGNKKGGLIKLAGGGLVPLAGGGKIAIGPGGGLDDLIPTSINGRRAAALSDGEFVIPADVVSMMGDGSSNAGARRLYDLVRQVRDNKTGTTRQAGPLPVGEILKRSMDR